MPTLDSKLGADRVVMDFCEGLRESTLNGDLFPPDKLEMHKDEYINYLSDYLVHNAHKYDVVDFPYHIPPWIKALGGGAKILKVARVVLLQQHQDFYPDPRPSQSMASRFITFGRSIFSQNNAARRRKQKLRDFMDINIADADLVNVANNKDRECLIQLGVDASKIIVLPYGLTDTGARGFNAAYANRQTSLKEPVIAFVGTFDYRKGCMDFPRLVRMVADSIPQVNFRLLGTRGLFASREKVLSFFPRELRRRVDVVPAFDPDQLPGMLSDCVAGVFPSYREGFGIAVVEMLAAGLPVIAYDVPGPCDILPDDWLVARGDIPAMADSITSLIQLESTEHTAQSKRAHEISRRFRWGQIARETFSIYKSRWIDLQK